MTQKWWEILPATCEMAILHLFHSLGHVSAGWIRTGHEVAAAEFQFPLLVLSLLPLGMLLHSCEKHRAFVSEAGTPTATNMDPRNPGMRFSCFMREGYSPLDETSKTVPMAPFGPFKARGKASASIVRPKSLSCVVMS